MVGCWKGTNFSLMRARMVDHDPDGTLFEKTHEGRLRRASPTDRTRPLSIPRHNADRNSASTETRHLLLAHHHLRAMNSAGFLRVSRDTTRPLTTIHHQISGSSAGEVPHPELCRRRQQGGGGASSQRYYPPGNESGAGATR